MLVSIHYLDDDDADDYDDDDNILREASRSNPMLVSIHHFDDDDDVSDHNCHFEYLMEGRTS